MNIAEFLDINSVALNSDISSKKRSLEEISRLLTSQSEFVAEKDVFTSLINREKLGSTGLGSGVAIPHGRLKGLDQAVGAFLRLDNKVDYDAPDGAGVDLIFGLLVPQNATSEHLEILAKIAQMFKDEHHLEALRGAQDAAELHRLISEYQPG